MTIYFYERAILILNENSIQTLKFIQSKLKLHEETLSVLKELVEGAINSKLAPLIVTMPDGRIKEDILNDIADKLDEKIEIISNPNPKNEKKDDT